MKLYSHAVLMTALAAPAFCQSPSLKEAQMAIEAQAAGRAEAAQFAADQAVQKAALNAQIDARNAELQAQAIAQVAIDQKFDERLGDAMAAQAEKLAQLSVQIDSQGIADKITDGISADKMAEIDLKIEAAAEKMKSFDLDSKLQDMQMKLDEKDFKMDMKDLKDFKFDTKDLEDKLGDLQFKIDTKIGDKFDMAFLQAPKPIPAPEPPAAPIAPKARFISINRGDGAYDQGTRALDQHHYEEAVMQFDAVINSKSTRTDGALYWKAYALNRSGKRDEALASLAQLRRDFPQSGWLNDAQVLEAEVRQSNGQPISPAQESNDDLKLLALNNLMNGDPERAIPLIEGVLKANSSPSVKDRALFVLAQSKSPRAQTVLSDYAKGGGNPDLQLRAIQYVSMSRSKESTQLLAGIYSSSNDMRVKNSILQQLAGARAFDSLLSIAKSEKDATLRNMAIRSLASDRSAPTDGLMELYGSADASAKHAIVDGFMNRHDAKTLIDLAKKESDASMKRYIVERVGSMRDSKEAMDYMMELLQQK